MEKAEEVIAKVGARIAEIRRAHGWTQQQLAELLRMEPQSVQRLERGTNLTIRTLVKLARVLEVPTGAFFEPPGVARGKPGRPAKR